MRNVLTYTLVTLYFLISIKITANVHVCQGKIKSITLVGFSKQKKCCKSPTMSSDCCKDFKFSFKKGNSQENSNSTILVKTITFETLPFIYPILFFQNYKIVSPKLTVSFYDPPPPEVFPKVYIKNCVYLI